MFTQTRSMFYFRLQIAPIMMQLLPYVNQVGFTISVSIFLPVTTYNCTACSVSWCGNLVLCVVS